MPPARRRLSIIEAATILGVNPKTVRRYIWEGRLPAVRVGPKLLRIDPRDLDQLAHPVPTGSPRDAA
jgi:excisionase family DNA binding protein